MKSRIWLGRILTVLLLWATQTSAQTFTVLTSLSSIAPPGGGGNLVWSLVQGPDGNFYGTTQGGGETCANNPFATCGVVFKVTPAGALTVIHDFCQNDCIDGGAPFSGLYLNPTGKFYGTTTTGTANHNGALYEITAAGTVTSLHSFTGTGAEGIPYGPVIEADGAFYGVTGLGGASDDGTIYKVTSNGTLTTLHTFSGTDGDEVGLEAEGLLQAPNGNLYGFTPYGTLSSNGCGTIFKITPAGAFTTLYGFDSNGIDGCGPFGGLALAPDGNIYATTVGGGDSNEGAIFRATPNDTVSELYAFCSQSNCADGSLPNAGLILATDGNFYGTTISGGTNNEGVIFQFTPSGAYTVLHSFCSQTACADGSSPYSRLTQATDGNFYGTTSNGGGGNNGGTAFKLSMGLAPFVQPISTSGKVGAQVGILGTNLKGTTSVTFNGTPATFKVEAGTAIVAKVPTGATTGKIKVVIPGGTLVSNIDFRVRQ